MGEECSNERIKEPAFMCGWWAIVGDGVLLCSLGSAGITSGCLHTCQFCRVFCHPGVRASMSMPSEQALYFTSRPTCSLLVAPSVCKPVHLPQGSPRSELGTGVLSDFWKGVLHQRKWAVGPGLRMGPQHPNSSSSPGSG